MLAAFAGIGLVFITVVVLSIVDDLPHAEARLSENEPSRAHRERPSPPEREGCLQ